MIVEPHLAPAGTLLKTHGIHGELVAVVDAPDYEPAVGGFIFVEVDGLEVPFRIDAVRPRGAESFLIILAGVADNVAAAALAGKDFCVEAAVLGSDGDDEDNQEGFYVDDLLGYTLVADGQPIGTVDDYDDSTDNILLKVLAPDGRLFLVPAGAEMIVDVDPDAQTLTMTLPEGLLDL